MLVELEQEAKFFLQPPKTTAVARLGKHARMTRVSGQGIVCGEATIADGYPSVTMTETASRRIRFHAKWRGVTASCVFSVALWTATAGAHAETLLEPTSTPDTIAATEGSPALDFKTPVTIPAPSNSVATQWWFWTALGVVVAATAVVVVASTRGQAPPVTNLGNQEISP
jgi:hypothetical protein